MLFEDVLALRGSGAAPLRPLEEKSGFIGDYTTKTFTPMGDMKSPGVPTAWLPTERVARAWQAMVTEKPFDR
jgi:hypothetical protein